MFEKKDREIKEQQANVSKLQTRVVKLEQQIDKNSAHERRNTLIMVDIIPLAQHAEAASSLCENKSENSCA